SATDLFSLGTAEARAAGMADAARLPYTMAFAATELDPMTVARAIGGVPLAPTTAVRFVATKGSNEVTLQCSAPREPGQLVALGMDVHRLRTALAAEGLVTSIVAVELE